MKCARYVIVAFLVLELLVVLTTLATHRSMDDALIVLLAISVVAGLTLFIAARTWMILPSTFIGILGLAMAIRGPDAHGRIDTALEIAFDATLLCFLVAGIWFGWKERRDKQSVRTS